MIWIVSKELLEDGSELENRHQYIEAVTGTHVTPWQEVACMSMRSRCRTITYYRCKSDKGEYGIVITAHMRDDVQSILINELSYKRAIVVINSCGIDKQTINECGSIVRSKNPNSEILLANQEHSAKGKDINYLDNVGSFGFPTTNSERELFQQRRVGFIKAIRKAYNKVVIL